MSAELSIIIPLAVLWFLFFWVFGGVFFAVITLLRFGRIRKVRFSCLLSLAALVAAVGGAKTGLVWAEDSIEGCMSMQNGWTDNFISLFGCGFVGILAAMLVWAGAYILLGFIFMAISKSNEQTWIDHVAKHIDENFGDKNK